MPIIRRSNCVPLPVVVCPVGAVVMLESRVARCVHCVENVVSEIQLDATNSDLLVINSISTCFGHLYAHRQEIRLRSIAYSCLSCCSCCDAGELGGKMCALCVECCLRNPTRCNK